MRGNPFGWRGGIVGISAALALAAALLAVLGAVSPGEFRVSVFLSVGVFLQALALVRLLGRPSTFAVTLSLLAALAGALGILGYLLAFNGVFEAAARGGFVLIRLVNMHLVGVLALFVGAAATFTAATRARHDFGAEALAAGGIVILGLVPAMLLGQRLHIAPLEGALAQPLLGGEALLLLAVGVLLLLAAAAVAHEGFDVRNRFLPALAFAALFAVSFHLWLALLGEEQQTIHRYTTGAALRIKAGLDAHLADRKQALERMAARLAVAGESRTRALWAADAHAYLRDFPSVSAIGWILPDGRVHWAMSHLDPHHLEGQPYAIDASRREALDLARRSGRTAFSHPVKLRGGGYGQIVALPLQEPAGFLGWLVVGLRFNELFATEIADTAADLSVRIRQGEQMLFEDVEEGARHPFSRAVVERVEADNLVLDIEVWPKRSFFENVFIWLPGLLLTLGLLAATLFAVSLYQLELQRRRTASLRASEERYRLVAEQTGALVYDYHLASGHIDWAGAIGEVAGSTPQRFAAVDVTAWEQRLHPDDADRVLRDLERSAAAMSRFRSVYRFARDDGRHAHVEDRGVFLPGPDGKAMRMLGTMSDISQGIEHEQQLRHLAHYDQQTELHNRVWFMEEAVRRADSRAAAAGPLWLVFLDVDRFRAVNETLGHVIGDLLLESVARRLEAVVDNRGELARIGGDEFGLCVNSGMDRDAMIAFCEQLTAEFARAFDVGGHALFVTLSIGIASFPDDGEDVQEVIRAAETAMFRAKHRGRNTWAFYEAAMSAGARENLEIANALRVALERNEFQLVFQPRYSLSGRRVTGMEALLRWNSAELGAIPPGVFIPVAEETGLIGPIGWYVVDAAADAARRIGAGRMQGLRVAINVSARQLIQADFVAELLRRIDAGGASPQWFELELTESLMMEDPGRARELFRQLHDAGFTISIDDFGTGYSSLSYLKHFPVDHLKIDRSFVMELPQDADDAAIVRTIIGMGKGLGLNLIAEGIETEAQWHYLRDAGCEEGQGYLFAHPMPLEMLIALLD